MNQMPAERSPPTRLRACTAQDAAAVAAIYNHYVRETVVTFEEEPVTTADMAQRIAGTTARFPWLVAETAGSILGYAYATTWKSRSAYRYSVESTVYLASDAAGRGLGTALYTALLAELEPRGVHSVIGGIALPNAASVALHEKLGFRKIGVFSEVGFKPGRWIDVGYWEKLL